ncbi:fimbrial protein [Salmonella enterica]|nr:fimbrial protein [Salmonella enterica]EDL3530275.1 fimbrial protein [Salmonella enterica subsp. enterica serovar Newport]EDU6134615.1 fimbrial protein [Salmonella enterica subsp. enterica]EBA1892453.1 fimbrial protein [Salmonella enterica]EBL7700901.1 fimbrial protein [Salmonella enterica]
MKKEYFALALSFFSCMACASNSALTTMNSTFEITNRTIIRANITSSDNSMTYSDPDHNGVYKISDKYQDANIPNVHQQGGPNQQVSLKRNQSLVRITLTGQNLGHKITVLGKLANSSVSIAEYRGIFFWDTFYNSGCTTVVPNGYVGMISGTITFKIESSNNVTQNCTGNTGSYEFIPHKVRVMGNSRDFYLDIGRLQNEPEYRKAPPDTYTGSGTLNGDQLVGRGGGAYLLNYANNITIVKNPYFEGVTMPSGDNVFDTRTTGGQIKGNLVIPYVINGQFTPYNTVSLNVTSLNGFKLKNTGSSTEIPYSLSTTVGSQRVYPLAKVGKSSGSVTLSNLEAESYAIQGRFNADFSIDKNSAQTGDYSDTLTAIFQITL